MRASPRTRIRPAARTHTHIHIYTPMYAHGRTYTRTRRNFSDNKSAPQHCQTEFHHQSDNIHFYYPTTVQSISILAPHWLHHLYKLSSSAINWHSLSSIRKYCPTIHRLLIIHSIICSANSHTLSLPPIISNSPSTHNIPSLSDFHPNQLTILSICQYIIKLC